MDLNQYVQDAIRTESRIDEVTTDRQLLMAMLKCYIASGTILDMIKKNVFYGKEMDRNVFNDCFLDIIRVGMTDMFLDEKPYTSEPVTVDVNPRIFHSIIGVLTESTELAEALEKIIVTGSADNVNILEEFGDIGWYEAIGVDELNGDLEKILTANIDKLRLRYPEKFTSDEAINRDVVTERALLEEGLNN